MKVSMSSGNVFADLGLGDAEELHVKAKLALQVAQRIKAKRLTQAKAARLLGIDQPKVSKLVRGNLRDFSTERLMKFLRLLGNDVEIVVRSRARGVGHFEVLAG